MNPLDSFLKYFEMSLFAVAVAIVLFPWYFKRLFKLNDKVVIIEYQYFPVPLKLLNFALHYKFSKNVTLITTSESISVHRKPNETKLILHIPHMHLHYSASKPVKIGCDLEAESLYRESIAHLIKSYFRNPPPYPNGPLK